jgi:hypothetical protein
MGQGVGGWKLEIEGWRLEVAAEVSGSIHINSPPLFLCLFFHFFSFFIFRVSCFKNISGMNSVSSLSKMFDRTAGWINRSMDCLSGMSMNMSMNMCMVDW